MGFRPRPTRHFCFGKSAQNHFRPCTSPLGKLRCQAESNGSETRSAQTVLAEMPDSAWQRSRARRRGKYLRNKSRKLEAWRLSTTKTQYPCLRKLEPHYRIIVSIYRAFMQNLQVPCNSIRYSVTLYSNTAPISGHFLGSAASTG